MNNHLSSEQISEFVAGGASAAIGEHLRECLACRSEAERLTDTLATFRQTVRDWSLELEHAPLPVARRKVRLRHLGWAAALAACLIAALALPHDRRDKPAASVPQVISDADLLGQVDRELSEAVPPSMAPMALQNEVQK